MVCGSVERFVCGDFYFVVVEKKFVINNFEQRHANSECAFRIRCEKDLFSSQPPLKSDKIISAFGQLSHANR